MPPRWTDIDAAEAADLAACRAMLRGGSRSFHAASLLLPRRVFEPAAALYAFCRLADDTVDIERGTVASLRDRLHRAYEGEPLPHAVDRAMARVVARHAIPAALPEALLEGFAWDTEGRRYEDFPALLEYAARVAGSVGAMMAMLMGVRAPDIVARACDLGVAMQLSNIARDVGEDARAGRLYLPLQWMHAAGIDPDAFLARPSCSAALGEVIRRLLGEAETLYARGDRGIACLPLSCRPGIAAARFLYAGIGHEVARRGFDPVSGRAIVAPRMKAALLARAMLSVGRRAGEVRLPALDAMRFLVDEVEAAPLPRACGAGAVRHKSFDDRVDWLVDLFTRLSDPQQLES